MQVLPQLTPAGLEVTVPVPVPARVTVSANVVVWLVNVAVTERAWVIDTVQVPVAFVQAPLQPLNVEPLAAVAVSVTDWPAVTLALQTLPQLIAPPDTVPVPVPVLVTDRSASGWTHEHDVTWTAHEVSVPWSAPASSKTAIDQTPLGSSPMKAPRASSATSGVSTTRLA